MEQTRRARRSLRTRASIVLLAAAVSALAVLALVSLVGAQGGFSAKATTAAVFTKPLQVPFDAGAASSRQTLLVLGSGFEPSQTLNIVISDGGGVLTDITALMEPSPMKANKDGALVAKWILGSWTRAGVGDEGLFTLRIMDTDLNILATTPVALCKTKRADGEKVPAFCE